MGIVALRALGAAGHMGQGVTADEVPVGAKNSGCHILSEGPQAGMGQDLHNVVGLQPGVWRGVDEDIGQGVLLVVHLICRGGTGHHGAALGAASAQPGQGHGAHLPCARSPAPQSLLGSPTPPPPPQYCGGFRDSSGSWSNCGTHGHAGHAQGPRLPQTNGLTSVCHLL